MSRGSSRGLSSTTSPTPCVRVPRHVARLLTRLVIDYFDYATHAGASAHREARYTARRNARRRLLHLRRTSGCHGTSRGSSRGSSSTTSTTPCVRVPRHVAWLVTRLVGPLVVDYFTYAAHPVASACHAARHAARRAARRQLLRLCRASECLGTSRGSSRGSSRRSSSTTSPTPLCLTQARRQLLHPHRASGCFGTSRGSSSTTHRLAARLLVGRSHWLLSCA
jgi:hypothetical protein